MLLDGKGKRCFLSPLACLCGLRCLLSDFLPPVQGGAVREIAYLCKPHGVGGVSSGSAAMLRLPWPDRKGKHSFLSPLACLCWLQRLLSDFLPLVQAGAVRGFTCFGRPPRHLSGFLQPVQAGGVWRFAISGKPATCGPRCKFGVGSEVAVAVGRSEGERWFFFPRWHVCVGCDTF